MALSLDSIKVHALDISDCEVHAKSRKTNEIQEFGVSMCTQWLICGIPSANTFLTLKKVLSFDFLSQDNKSFIIFEQALLVRSVRLLIS